jgi:hypothetical protein
LGTQILKSGDCATGDFHPYYHHGLKKNLSGVFQWGKPYDVRTNSLGLRDKSVRDVPAASDKYRILFMGDSFTFGIGIPYEQTFVGRVAGLLDERKIEVLNAAVISYSPKLYFLKTKYLIEQEKLRFNEEYVYLDISDVQDELNYERFVPHLNFFYVAARRLDILMKNHSFLYYHLRRLISQHPYDRLNLKAAAEFDDRQHRIAAWTYDKDAFNAWGKKGLALEENYMDLLARLCQEHGIRLTIAVYPWRVSIEKNDRHSIQERFWKYFAARRGLGFIDHFPDFFKKEVSQSLDRYFIPGDAHWQAPGHQIIAEGLLKYWKDSHRSDLIAGLRKP